MRRQPLGQWIVALGSMGLVRVSLWIVPRSLIRNPILLSSIVRSLDMSRRIVVWRASSSSTATSMLASTAAARMNIMALVWGCRRLQRVRLRRRWWWRRRRRKVVTAHGDEERR
jgi:hypothetical protein